jgi:coenzyme Q-binding protein COQ10
MTVHSEKRLVPYSCAQMYDLVADVERYPEFLPWCRDAIVFDRTEIGFQADLIVGSRLFSEHFRSRVSLRRPYEIKVEYGGGALRSLNNQWRFRDIEKNGCEIHFEVDFQLRSVVLGTLMDSFFDKAFCKMSEAFEKRAKTIYNHR